MVRAKIDTHSRSPITKKISTRENKYTFAQHNSVRISTRTKTNAYLRSQIVKITTREIDYTFVQPDKYRN